MAPRGYGAILHVMEFKWDRHGVKSGVGGNDSDLIAQWPGLLYDNTTDCIMWGVRAKKPAADPPSLGGADLLHIAAEMTKTWNPGLAFLSTAAFAASDGTSAGNGTGAAANQPGAASGQTDAIPSKMHEGRAAKTSPTNSPQDAPTGVGGGPNSAGTPAAPNTQGN
jgi:hypothetical protein